MEKRRLGRTDVMVSALCLGTMTWGSQNTEAEAHAQIDYALDQGVNFIDVAEMYPVTPRSAETTGDSERFLGSWVAANPRRRGDVILATKIVGRGYDLVRDGAPISSETIPAAVAGSLERLQTDYIDLYQLHWPNRGHYHFRNHWAYDPSAQDTEAVLANLEESLRALEAEVTAGRVRHIGLSNETAWGVMQHLRIAEANGSPRVASIQNEYSFMRRFFDLDLAEVAHHEQVGLLAYTPLVGGLLTGKYAGGAMPPGSRATINKGLNERMTETSMPAADAYVDIARRHGLDPAQMALAWARARPFMTSVIFGATTMAQLEIALGSADLQLSDGVVDEIQQVFRRYPKPF